MSQSKLSNPMPVAFSQRDYTCAVFTYAFCIQLKYLLDIICAVCTNSNVRNKVRLRKQTQDIAARAAQRRANLHHKELMEDMGKFSFYDNINLELILICFRFSIFL